MFIGKKEYIVQVSAILQEGVDFTKDDLEPNSLVGGALLELSSLARGRIACKLGFLSMSWAGHYDPDSKTVECILKNPVYINEESGKVISKN